MQNKSTASWRYSAVSVAKEIIRVRPQVAPTQNRISISGRANSVRPQYYISNNGYIISFFDAFCKYSSRQRSFSCISSAAFSPTYL